MPSVLPRDRASPVLPSTTVVPLMAPGCDPPAKSNSLPEAVRVSKSSRARNEVELVTLYVALTSALEIGRSQAWTSSIYPLKDMLYPDEVDHSRLPIVKSWVFVAMAGTPEIVAGAFPFT